MEFVIICSFVMLLLSDISRYLRLHVLTDIACCSVAARAWNIAKISSIFSLLCLLNPPHGLHVSRLQVAIASSMLCRARFRCIGQIRAVPRLRFAAQPVRSAALRFNVTHRYMCADWYILIYRRRTMEKASGAIAGACESTRFAQTFSTVIGSCRRALSARPHGASSPATPGPTLRARTICK